MSTRTRCRHFTRSTARRRSSGSSVGSRTTAATEPPGTELSIAVGYLVNHWKALTLYVTDGTLDIDNNALERRFRYLSLGRKNFRLAGSYAGAERVAIFYSVINDLSVSLR